MEVEDDVDGWKLLVEPAVVLGAGSRNRWWVWPGLGGGAWWREGRGLS